MSLLSMCVYKSALVKIGPTRVFVAVNKVLLCVLTTEDFYNGVK